MQPASLCFCFTTCCQTQPLSCLQLLPIDRGSWFLLIIKAERHTIAKKLFAQVSAQSKVNSSLSSLVAFICHVACQVSATVPELPSNVQPSLLASLNILESTIRQKISMVRHSVPCSSRNLAVAFCHHAWLHLTSLQADAIVRIEDLPFDGIDWNGTD